MPVNETFLHPAKILAAALVAGLLGAHAATAGGAPVYRVPSSVTANGTLDAGPSPGRPPVASDTLVYAMPDIMATTLGFVLAGSPHAWGSTFSVDLPHHVAATRAGPNANLCLFEQAAYRAFNKGPVATGAFVSRVTRNGVQLHAANLALGPQANQWVIFGIALPEGTSTLKVRLDALHQVSESDESNNAPQVTVLVNLDCDGDGRIAGRNGLAVPLPATRLEPPQRSLRHELMPPRPGNPLTQRPAQRRTR